jgi:hypothetical protein
MVVYSGVIIYDVTIHLEKMPLLLVQMALIVSIPNNHNNMINHLLDLVTANDDRNKKQESVNVEFLKILLMLLATIYRCGLVRTHCPFSR